MIVFVGILYTIFIAAVFFVLGFRASRPKLIYTGGGHGQIRVPNRDVMATSLRFTNAPSFLGMKINRGPARIKSARIYDPDMEQYAGPPLM